VQAAVECALRAGAAGIGADDVERMECELPAEVAWLVCEPWAEKLAPASGHVAKFSLPYCLAAALVDGEVDVGTFDRPGPDPRLAPLMARIGYRPMADSGFPSRYPARLRIETRSGRVHEESVMDVHGAPERPFAVEEVRAKFRRNASRMLRDDAVEEAMEAISTLDRAASPAHLGRALRTLRD
jgi:2-methylcitrate dehydratase PrpD